MTWGQVRHFTTQKHPRFSEEIEREKGKVHLAVGISMNKLISFLFTSLPPLPLAPMMWRQKKRIRQRFMVAFVCVCVREYEREREREY